MKWFIKYLIITLLAVAPLQSMQKMSSQNSTEIDMDRAMSLYAPKGSCYKLWTGGLCGCVATIIDIEHINGDHSICMCHYSYEAIDQNKVALENFLKIQDMKNIKKASCILVPPGIHKKFVRTTPVPIFDPAWKSTIITTIQKYIPHAKIIIKPYLFNDLTSEVHYSYAAGNTLLEITDKSSTIDEESIEVLLETHNYETKDSQYKSALVPVIAAALVGFYLYYITG